MIRKKGRHRKIGQPPGSIQYTGDQTGEPVRIRITAYSGESLEDNTFSESDDWKSALRKSGVNWLHLEGLHREGLIQAIGTHLGIHSLVLEDMVNVHQGSKVEVSQDYIFICMKKIDFHSNRPQLESEHFSIVFGPGFVLSFREKPADDLFSGVRRRLDNPEGRLRSRGSDYLAYALLDTLVDHGFHALEEMDILDEELEEAVVSEPNPDTVRRLHEQKRRLITLRRNFRPLREPMGKLFGPELSLIEARNHAYFHDVRDHLIQILDMVDARRELNTGFLDLYLSGLSHRMNEVMKVLTVIATIFIPLTFIAGIYGMNFQFMPELKWPWGYFAALGLMAVIAGGMIYGFKRKKWL